jgi:hypothetical protein
MTVINYNDSEHQADEIENAKELHEKVKTAKV